MRYHHGGGLHHQALDVACPAERLPTPANLGGCQHHGMSQQRPKLSAVLPERSAFYLLASAGLQLQLVSHLYTVSGFRRLHAKMLWVPVSTWSPVCRIAILAQSLTTGLFKSDGVPVLKLLGLDNTTEIGLQLDCTT